MQDGQKKTLGQAIDVIVDALTSLNETDRTTAIRAACDHLAIPPPLAVGGMAQEVVVPREDARAVGILATPTAASDVRSLKDQKHPKTAKEMAWSSPTIWSP